MNKLVLIGTGNVAMHLFRALRECQDLEVIQVVGRDPAARAYFGSYTDTAALPEISQQGDLYLMAVSDDTIATVSRNLPLEGKLLVHTSGSVPLEALTERCRRGVFYPLQTFSKNRHLSLREVPLCLEAEDSQDLVQLQRIANRLSDRVYQIGSEQRRQLHLAAVFANNFTNHLYYLSQQILEGASLPFDMLLPLIGETAAKLQDVSPHEAQTGPARRADEGTIAAHRQLLKDATQKDVYTLLSNSIKQTYGKKL